MKICRYLWLCLKVSNSPSANKPIYIPFKQGTLFGHYMMWNSFESDNAVAPLFSKQIYKATHHKYHIGKVSKVLIKKKNAQTLSINGQSIMLSRKNIFSKIAEGIPRSVWQMVTHRLCCVLNMKMVELILNSRISKKSQLCFRMEGVFWRYVPKVHCFAVASSYFAYFCLD